MFGTIAYLIFRLSQRWVPPGVAYLLAALFVSAPLAQMVTGSMFVENFTAALAIGAMCALWEFYEGLPVAPYAYAHFCWAPALDGSSEASPLPWDCCPS